MMDWRCRVELFGGITVQQGARTITRFRSRQTAALLAYLAYFPELRHSREKLIELIWRDADRSSGQLSLRVALSSLRRQLEPPGTPRGTVLITDSSTAALNPLAVITDVCLFEKAHARARQSVSPVERVVSLSEAAELYRGELLSGYYEEWIPGEQERLRSMYLDSLQQLVAYYCETDLCIETLRWSQRLTLADPLSEAAHLCVIGAYMALGRYREAIHQFEILKKTLKRELNEKPSTRAREMARQARTASSREEPFRPERAASQTITSLEGQGRNDDLPGSRTESFLTGSGKGTTFRTEDSTARVATLPYLLPGMPNGAVTLLLVEFQQPIARQDEAAVLAEPPEHSLTTVRRALHRCGGQELKHGEGTIAAAFARVSDAFAGAALIQQLLLESAPAGGEGDEQTAPHPVSSLRMAIHTGETADEPDGQALQVLHHARRILLAAGHGQVLCSEDSAVLGRRCLAAGIGLRPLGALRLRGVQHTERLWEMSRPGASREPAPFTNGGDSGPDRLPLPLSRFFGREHEMDEIRKWLLTAATGAATGESGWTAADGDGIAAVCAPSRILTLVGSGGAGKTRLALEAAARMATHFQGAVWFVSLGSVSEARMIPDAILDTLRLAGAWEADTLALVEEILGHGPALLVLDNFEHLVDDGAEIVRVLARRLPGVLFLITSRRALHLQEEQQLPIPPLPIPEVVPDESQFNSCPSVQLFVHRAQAVRPDFGITGANRAAVAELCRRLEGIPLALELAAARIQMLTPAQMLQHMDSPLDFLVTRKRDLQTRHRSLREAIEWSYRLLPRRLDHFFAQLAVFRGSFTLEAAEAICGKVEAEVASALDVFEALDHLRECSLLLSKEHRSEMRFCMLDALREFAAEQLPQDDFLALEHRHAWYYLNIAEAARVHLEGPDGLEWLQGLEEDLDNLRAAFAASKRHEWWELTARLALALYPLLYRRGFWTEARTYLQSGQLAATCVEGDTRSLRASIACALAKLAHDFSDFPELRLQAEQSFTLRNEIADRGGVAEVLNVLGAADLEQELWEQAQTRFEQALEMAPHNAPAVRAIALHNLGKMASIRGELARAERYYEQAIMHRDAAGDIRGKALTLGNMGAVAFKQQNYVRARQLYTESLEMHRLVQERYGAAVMLNNLAELSEIEGDLKGAVQRFARARHLFEQLHSRDARYPAEALRRLEPVVDPAAFAEWCANAAARGGEDTLAGPKERDR